MPSSRIPTSFHDPSTHWMNCFWFPVKNIGDVDIPAHGACEIVPYAFAEDNFQYMRVKLPETPGMKYRVAINSENVLVAGGYGRASIDHPVLHFNPITYELPDPEEPPLPDPYTQPGGPDSTTTGGGGGGSGGPPGITVPGE